MQLMKRSDNINDVLAEIETTLTALNPDAAGDGGWRERKSAQTRIMILDAAVHCLAKYGYAKTSTQFVAATAEVSRGAMLHHYATKAALISSVIDYIDAQRLRAIYEDVKKLTDEERIVEGKAFEITWRLMKTPEAQAHLELNMASRTDAALRKIFDKKSRRYKKITMEILPNIFPEWRDTPVADLELAHDVIQVALTGLSLHERLLDRKERRVALRKFVFDAVQRLRER